VSFLEQCTISFGAVWCNAHDVQHVLTGTPPAFGRLLRDLSGEHSEPMCPMEMLAEITENLKDLE
jgi:hypothetical protein